MAGMRYWTVVMGLFILPFALECQTVQPETLDPELFSLETLADPASGIELIQAPEVDAQGVAQLEYPITLPPGRKGMTPDLNLTYRSELENGWLGWGWDLTIPAIEIDTRWGVPRFSATEETETYLLNGEQLTPLAHRGALQPRTSEKTFHSRVETEFLEIVRHGNQPANYWWEVWDVSGNRYRYGGPASNAFLVDDAGRIVQWALREIRDADGNTITFHYEVGSHAGINGSSISGRYLYPDRVTYTGFAEVPGPFEVQFLRDRQLGETARPDKLILGRLGFKEVCGDLLRRIIISYQGEVFRSYELTYTTGAFGKTLLASIAQFDGKDSLFYRHQFTYYNDVEVNSGYEAYLPTVDWDVPYDQVRGKIVNPIPGFDGEVTSLGGDASNNIGGSTVVTVGPLGDPTSKFNSAGGSFAYASSQTQGLLALVDIDGDGLPDKVYQKQGALYYRSNQYRDRGGFGPEYRITGITNFSNTKASSTSVGAEGHVGPVFGGYEHTSTSSRATTYFTDFNGDDLIDVAYDGAVYFNHINADGRPEFTRSSSLTPNPIRPMSPPDPSIFIQDPAELEKKINDFPLHDVVKMWQAPDTGIVQINAPVQLKQDPTSTTYPQKDGVRVAIQKKGQELWSARIQGEDYGFKLPTNVSQVQVNKGDRIYFRVQSVFDGAYDQVHWDPHITYLSLKADTLTPNGKSRRTYVASADFLLTSLQSLHMPLNGRVRIEGPFRKGLTTDDLHVQVLQVNGSDSAFIMDRIFPSDTTVDVDLVLDDVPVADTDIMYFRIQSTTQVDWKALDWKPRIYYTQSDSQAVIGTNGHPLLDFYPVVDYTMFNDQQRNTNVWISPGTGPLQVEVPLPRIADTLSGAVTLSIKSLRKLIAKQTLQVRSGAQPQNVALTVPVIANDSLWIEIFTTIPEIAPSLRNAKAIRQLNGLQEEFKPGIATTNRDQQALFGPLYRGWGHFAYFGNGARANQPIVEGDLKLDDKMMNIDTSEIDLEDPESLGDLFNTKEAPFIILIADVLSGKWIGYDNLTYLRADVISSSRFGEDDLTVTGPESNGEGLAAPTRRFKNTMHSVAADGGVGIVNASAGTSWSEAETLLDVMDMNGDRYPDIVTTDKIQYSTVFGGWESTSVPYDLGNHLATSNSLGANLGGGFIYSSASNSGEAAGGTGRASRVKSRTGTSSKRSRSAAKTAAEAIGISGNYTTDEDHAEHSWMDMNGDGLADKVFRDGRVALNLGYRFAPAEDWGFAEIRSGKSTDYCAGLGVNYMSGSVVAGTSLSRTDIWTTGSLEDLNGDGLPDYIVQIDPLRVRMNTGSGFGPEQIWKGIAGLETSSATGESINTAFTACVPIVILGIRICVNPGFFTGQGVSRTKSMLEDINGDGFTDYLVAGDNDGELQVAPSGVGRTNRLKTVENPLGGSLLLDYGVAGNTYDLPYGQWVVTEIDQMDGVPGDGTDTIRTTYAYQEGYYDRRERMFYGFGQVEMKEWDGDTLQRIVQSSYDVSSYYRRGLKLGEMIFDGRRKPYLGEQFIYELRYPETGTIVPSSLEKEENAFLFPALVSRQSNYYEGADIAALQHRTDYNYDNHGNLILEKDYGNGTPEDELETLTSYHELVQQHIYSVPKEIIISDVNGWIRRRTVEIDDAGNTIETRDYLSEDSMAINSYTFDVYGNLLTFTRPVNLHGDRLMYSYRWDAALHTYLEEVEDGYGYQSSYRYDPRFGTLLAQTGINGDSILFTYDDFGRLLTITSPFEVEAGKPYSQRYAYHLDAQVPYAEAFSYDAVHDRDIRSVQFKDGLDRSIQTKYQRSLFHGEGQPDDEVMVVSGLVQYDGMGREIASYYPVTEPVGQAALFNTERSSVTPTRINYDALDRTVKETRPDGSELTLAYDIAADDRMMPAFHTTMSDALGNRRHGFWDVRNRQTATMEESTEGEVWTSFSYNALSELINSRDDQGVDNTYRYDRLGRQTFSSSPDGGDVRDAYDLADNLVSRVTSTIQEQVPDGGAIQYDYDHERILHISYPKNIQNDVFYHYGDADAKFGRVGRIWLIEDASGGKELMYDALGNVEKEIRTLLINSTHLSTYVSTLTTDTWGRTITMKYPDAEKVDYQYNSGGMLAGIQGEKSGHSYEYLKQLGYDAFGDRTFMLFGNRIHEGKDFDPERRQLRSIKAGKVQDLFMKLEYQYDAESNVSRMSDQSAPQNPALQETYQAEFQYDKLNRLINGKGDLQGNQNQSFQLDMAYIHAANARMKQQVIMVNGKVAEGRSQDWTFNYSSRHAPDRINDKQLMYDENGNLADQSSITVFDNRQMIWDEENRLAGVSDNGNISRYTYDADGERVIKSHGASQGVFLDGETAGFVNHTDNYTAYVSPYLTIQEDRFIKHYYADGVRFLSKQGTGKFVHDLLPTYRGLTAGNLDYQGRVNALNLSLDRYYRELGIPPGPPTLYGYYASPDLSGQPLPGSSSGQSLNLPPASWNLLIGPPDTTGPPGPPVWIDAADTALAEPGYGFSGDPLAEEILDFYYLSDPLGNVKYVTNHAGEVTRHVSYLPFGEILADEKIDDQIPDYLFAGKERDVETGMYYFGARYFDRRMTLWQSPDPQAGTYPGISPYAYVANNPLKYADPDGNRIVIPVNSSNAFKKDVSRALHYIRKSPSGRSLINYLQGRNRLIYIKETKSLSGVKFNPDQLTVTWHPRSAMKVTGGGKQTAALGLAHELGHAYERIHNKKRESAEYASSIKYFDNKAERRIIMGPEYRIAQELGEATRADHHGTPYLATSPTSRQAARPQDKTRVKKPLQPRKPGMSTSAKQKKSNRTFTYRPKG